MRILRKVIVTIFIIVCFVLQCSVFDSLSFAGIIPNLMIILTASFGFMRGEKEGLIIGFFCGLLSDVFFWKLFGVLCPDSHVYRLFERKFSRIFYPEDIKLPMALIVVSDLSYGIVCYVLMFLLRGRFHFWYYFTRVILPEALYTIVVTLFLYPVILKVNEKLEAIERRSAQKFV